MIAAAFYDNAVGLGLGLLAVIYLVTVLIFSERFRCHGMPSARSLFWSCCSASPSRRSVATSSMCSARATTPGRRATAFSVPAFGLVSVLTLYGPLRFQSVLPFNTAISFITNTNFQRLGDHQAADGVGLGLTVAQGFVDAMGGRLTLDDTPGCAATNTRARCRVNGGDHASSRTLAWATDSSQPTERRREYRRHMELGLHGRRAAVAAASGGLGFASAAALTAEGARVVICGRDLGRIEAAAAQIGHGCIGLVQDVADAAGGASFVAAASEALGGLDIVVANGGGPAAGNFAATPVDAYQAALDLNLLSVVGMAKVAVPAMQAQGWGRFIAITSLSARQPMANLILSNTARAGVTGFLKTVAREVARDGVTVNSVQPGLHATNRLLSLYGGDMSNIADGVPAGVIGDPADFGSIVTFLCSDQAKFVTGLQLHIDGGSYAALQ